MQAAPTIDILAPESNAQDFVHNLGVQRCNILRSSEFRTGKTPRLYFLSGTSAEARPGNGVYAMSQVRSLCRQPQTQVLVLSGKPCGFTGTSRTWGAQLIEVEVSRWGSLDSHAPWEEFASKAGSDAIRRQVADFKPNVCLFVDWSALPAWQSIKLDRLGGVPAVYLNYRVFSRTETGSGKALVHRLEADAMEQSAVTVVLSTSDRDYLLQHVARPGHPAALPTCKVLLCALREELKELHVPADLEAHGGPAADSQAPPTSADPQTLTSSGSLLKRSLALPASNHQVPPALGSPAGGGEVSPSGHGSIPDPTATNVPSPLQPAQPLSMAQCPAGQGPGPLHAPDTAPSPPLHAAPWQRFQAGRPYLTCCVRLAREKEPERFVALVAHLRRTLARHGLTPLLVGPANDSYAQGIKQRLREIAPSSVIIERFMGPQELAVEVFSKTRLNIHPCTYDAFGMTIVEAASMGAPSLVHSVPGAVGAADLLQAGNAEVLLTDVAADPAVVAAHVIEMLDEGERLLHVARRAAERARSWTEDTNAKALLDIVKHAVDARETQEHAKQQQMQMSYCASSIQS